jgi:hypothetical protein
MILASDTVHLCHIAARTLYLRPFSLNHQQIRTAHDKHHKGRIYFEVA